MSSAFRSGTSSRAWMVEKTTRSPMLIWAVSGEALRRRRSASRGPALADPCSVYWAVEPSDSRRRRAMVRRTSERRAPDGGPPAGWRASPPTPPPRRREEGAQVGFHDPPARTAPRDRPGVELVLAAEPPRPRAERSRCRHRARGGERRGDAGRPRTPPEAAR